jgi:hypothetical protein
LWPRRSSIAAGFFEHLGQAAPPDEDLDDDVAAAEVLFDPPKTLPPRPPAHRRIRARLAAAGSRLVPPPPAGEVEQLRREVGFVLVGLGVTVVNAGMAILTGRGPL